MAGDVAGDVASYGSDVAIQGPCNYLLGLIELKLLLVDPMLDSNSNYRLKLNSGSNYKLKLGLSSNYRLNDLMLTQLTLIQD